MIEDKVLLEILRNRFQAIVDEMAQALFRTAHTVFVKETQDYGSVLVTTKGEIFAAPRRYGVLMMVGMPMDDAIRCIQDDINEGDVFISNDPESTRGMCTHLSDVFLWKPVFFEGELVCYAWTFVHASDVGGRVSGSIAPSSYEIYQEGIRIPPRKLFDRGKLDESFLDMFLANCRVPDQNWGDMKACLAALNTGERRVHALIERYGEAIVNDCIEDVLDYAEAQARRIIEHVPDGIYTYIDYMEADMVGLGLVRIKLNLVVQGDEILLDFTGTDPQVRASLNLPSYEKTGHWQLVTGLVNWLCTVEPEIAYNAGLVRPIKVKIPRGSLLNPEPGAACGARSSTALKLADIVIGALAQAVPDEVPAIGCGQGSILLAALPDFKTGKTKVSVLQPIIGGSGARPREDGVDGTDVIMNFLRNIPTESIENDMSPILVTRYSLREDSGGPGKYRGGTGVVVEFMTTSPYTVVTSRCMERYLFPPPGRLGGWPGTTGYTLLNPDSDEERDIGKIDVLEMAPGDRLRIGTQGGGGIGDPLDRPIESVITDVKDGLVSVDTARHGYGVVVDSCGELDEFATNELRARLREGRKGVPPIFSFGEYYDAYRARWPIALEDAVAEAVASLPTLLRQFLHRQLKSAIEERLTRGEVVKPEDVKAILTELEGRLAVSYPRAKVDA